MSDLIASSSTTLAPTLDPMIEIKTVQANSFKILIEGLKDVFSEVNFQVDSTGIKLNVLNKLDNVFIYVHLDAKNFNTFKCTKKMVWGFYMPEFYKYVKRIGRDDILTIVQSEAHPEYINIMIENESDKSLLNNKITLQDNNIQEYQVSMQSFSSIITMSSNKFQKIITHLASFSSEIDITSCRNQLLFHCNCANGNDEIEYVINGTVVPTESAESQLEQDSDEVVHGKYAASHLLQISKLSNLCNSVELKFKKKYPLLIKFLCGALGQVVIALS